MTDERDKALADLEAFRRKAQSGHANIEAFLRKYGDAARNVHDAKSGAKATRENVTPAPIASAGKPKAKRRRPAGDLLNEHDVAEALSVSVQTIRRWRMYRRGPKFAKVNDFNVRYKPEDVAAWLNAQPTGGDQSKKGK